jgi:acyl-CoA thioester hydrolase
MSGLYRYDFAVPETAIDENGHVNNVEYLRWMQDLAVRHSDNRGGTRAVKAIGAAWVARSHRVEYLKPAFKGDRVAAFTWVSSFRGVSSIRKYKFFRVDDKAVLAEGETNWVFIEAESGRPRTIPDEVTRLFEPVSKDNEPTAI